MLAPSEPAETWQAVLRCGNQCRRLETRKLHHHWIHDLYILAAFLTL
jgi:hypothetical protein